MCEVPHGVLLSGGLDSSLIASITSRVAKRIGDEWGKLHSFAVGIEGAPDLKYAAQVQNRNSCQANNIDRQRAALL